MKVPNTKLHENPFSGSQADTCGETKGRTNMTKVTDDFREYENAQKSMFPRMTEFASWKKKNLA